MESKSDFEWAAAKHIFVLSSAGKPVFSLSGDEQHLSPLMGLIQGLMSLCGDCDGDEMESISAGRRRFVFLRVGDLILVAVSSTATTNAAERLRDDAGAAQKDGGLAAVKESPENESFLRLQLEYMYAGILFFLTSKVQTIFRKSPGYDLRGLLGGADSSLRGLVDLADAPRGRGRLLASAVETVWMDPSIRSRVSRALQAAQEAAAPSALYAIWLCEEKLVSIAQPKAHSLRLHSRDLLLLVNFVATQAALRNAESWTPVCFPRFQEKGYLYAYISFLKTPGTTTAPEESWPSGDTVGKGEGTAGNALGGSVGESCVVLVSVEASFEQFQAFRRARTALEPRFRSALGPHWDRFLGEGAALEREAILTKFCSQLQALHFFYCLRGKRGGAPCVTQCLSPPFMEPVANDPPAQRRIWRHYTRAALRLRRGSCQECRVVCDAEDELAVNSAQDGARQSTGGHEHATALFESDPVHSLVYKVGATETIVSLFGQRDSGSSGAGAGGVWPSPSASKSCGDRDELHVCFPSGVTPDAAHASATRLVSIIRRDREWLFVTGTGAPK